MKNRQEIAMRQYAEAARAHYDAHPEHEIALHQTHLDSLGLSEAAKAHLVSNRLASVAAYIGGDDGLRQKMAGLDDASQVAAIQKIHEAERSGAQANEEDENEKTDAYLRSRGRR